jgi:hypothetical protein
MHVFALGRVSATLQLQLERILLFGTPHAAFFLGFRKISSYNTCACAPSIRTSTRAAGARGGDGAVSGLKE